MVLPAGEHFAFTVLTAAGEEVVSGTRDTLEQAQESGDVFALAEELLCADRERHGRQSGEIIGFLIERTEDGRLYSAGGHALDCTYRMSGGSAECDCLRFEEAEQEEADVA
jgi:hypothetical protein